MSKRLTQILLVDDHEVVRRGLRQILNQASDMKVVAECDNGVEALQWLSLKRCDVVILDIAMPMMNGIELLKELSAHKIPVSVLVMTAYPEEQYAIGLINAGVLGYLNKESGIEEILTAVRHVARGEMHFSKSVMALLANQFDLPSTKHPHEQLSKREFQIFISLASANTVTEIASNLCLSTKTISTYRTRILEKMNLRTNSELSHYAIEHHLLG